MTKQANSNDIKHIMSRERMDLGEHDTHKTMGVRNRRKRDGMESIHVCTCADRKSQNDASPRNEITLPTPVVLNARLERLASHGGAAETSPSPALSPQERKRKALPMQPATVEHVESDDKA